MIEKINMFQKHKRLFKEKYPYGIHRRPKVNEDQSLNRDKEAGYSLLEVLVALAIIASLTAVVAPRLSGHVDKSKTVSTKSQVKQLKASLGLLQMDLGRYPTEAEGLRLLVEPLGTSPLWKGPYLNGEIPLDAWGNPFGYESNPSDNILQGPRVFSLGSDNAVGGEGLAAEVDG